MFPVGSLFRLRVSHHLGRATLPSPRLVERSMRISRTALSCLLRLKDYGPILPERLSALVEPLGSHRRASESDSAIPYSTAPSPKPCRFRARSIWRRIFFSTQSFTKPKHSLACPTAK